MLGFTLYHPHVKGDTVVTTLFRYQIFLHESSAGSLLMRIEWSTTVFRDHLLNFKKTVDFDNYNTRLVLDIHQK
jgi:hypothetical protein